MKTPYFPIYANDDLADASCLSLEEYGAYTRLRCYAWKEEPTGTLPDNDDALSRYAGVSVAKWQEMKLYVMRAFRLEDDGRWHHPQIDKYIRETGAQGLLKGDWLDIRLEVLDRDAYTCRYCGQSATTVDHLIPRTRGGGNELENLVAACRPCNSRKKDRTPEEAGMIVTGASHG